MTESDIGPAEASITALIDSLGRLTPLERVTADAAFALVRAMADEGDGSKLAALSRELRQTLGALPRAGSARPTAAGAPDGDLDGDDRDPIARLADEVAAKRAQRSGQSA